MLNLSTPGVYTQEVPLLPQSVAGVSTAIPAFIGYTEKASKLGKSVLNVAIRISTFLEYKEIFGFAKPSTVSATITQDRVLKSVEVVQPTLTMYHELDMYFKNGGGDCYIIAIGDYDTGYEVQNFLDGLDVLANEDEPTLIVLGDAVNLSNVDYHQVCVKALQQCEILKDRFCIFDIQNTLDVDSTHDSPEGAFRQGVGESNLKYGAAYTPFLQTALNHVYVASKVNISTEQIAPEEVRFFKIYQDIEIKYTGVTTDSPKIKISSTATNNALDFSTDSQTLGIINVPTAGITAKELVEAWEKLPNKNDFEIISLKDEGNITRTGNGTFSLEQEAIGTGSTSTLESEKGTPLYNEIVSEIAKEKIILPPSASLAGVYTTIDRQRGVWKAPANVSLNSVIAPLRKINSLEQEKLNVDDTGKSINAIRSFVGRGTLVWGARTLAGNDNEWRYISVRRLFNMIEESTKKASHFAVFESNDATTWLKVKAMIDSFLYGIWQQGGLAGSTEEQAYFVNIGLGKTMTQQDILEGKMIVEIGIAATRPAEFIVLKFSHKLQEV